MKREGAGRGAGTRAALHFPTVPRPVPYWMRLIPPGEFPRRAVVVRLVLAVTLATGLWVIVSSAEDPVRTVTYAAVPVTVLSPAGYYPIQSPPSVTVVVKGLASQLKETPSPSAFANVTSVAVRASQRVHVRLGGLPSGVEIQSVTPSIVKVQLEVKASKTVPVVAEAINAPLGFVVSQPIVTPNTVTVTGPSHAVNAARTARVVVDASPFRGDQVLTREPTVYDANGLALSRRVIRIQPGTVSISIHVSPQKYHSLVPVQAVITGTVGIGYRISGVTVQPSLVPVLSNDPIPASLILKTQQIDIAGLTSSRNDPSVALIVPSGLTLPHPVQESVTVEVVAASGSAVSTAQILVIHPRPGTSVTLDTPSVVVVYQGVISALGAAPQAVIDLHDRLPGVYHLTPTVLLSRGVSLVAVHPMRVRVVITAPPSPQPTAKPRPTDTSQPTLTPRPTVTPRPTATPRPKVRRRSKAAIPLPTRIARLVR